MVSFCHFEQTRLGKVASKTVGSDFFLIFSAFEPKTLVVIGARTNDFRGHKNSKKS